MAKYVYLEWKKLRRLNVISEVIVYFLIIMFLPVLFFKEIFPLASGSYDSAIDVLAGMQVGFVLFGASLINQVFVEECELPSTYHPCGLLEVGASRVILSHDRKLTELTLLFREFVFSC